MYHVINTNNQNHLGLAVQNYFSELIVRNDGKTFNIFEMLHSDYL